jgi:hypothetical protein
MRSTLIGLAVVVSLGLSTWARAQEHAAPHANAATTAHATPHDATAAARQPVPPDTSPMPGSVIILVLGMFLSAAIVGPVVRYHTPEPPPEPSDHDDHGPAAHDHAHGHGHGH